MPSSSASGDAMPSASRPRVVVLTSAAITPARIEELRREAPDLDLVPATDATVGALLPGAVAVVGCPRKALGSDVLRDLPELRWVHVGGAGIEDFLDPAFVRSPVVLTNGRTLQGPAVADHALALLLALTRNIAPTVQGLPLAAVPRPVELHAKTAVVAGVGGIGMLVAERLHAFGMRVVGVDAEVVPMARCVERVVLPAQLGEVVPEADVVVCAAPATPATERLFDRATLARCKRGAWFVNVSRGRLVDTAALTDALAEGRLAGAGLDVTDPEPLPEGHALRKMPNVVLTPHQAGLSDHNRDRAYALAKENLRRFARGEPLLNVVDKERGY